MIAAIAYRQQVLLIPHRFESLRLASITCPSQWQVRRELIPPQVPSMHWGLQGRKLDVYLDRSRGIEQHIRSCAILCSRRSRALGSLDHHGTRTNNQPIDSQVWVREPASLGLIGRSKGGGHPRPTRND